jgi:hypothetical protein
MSFLMLVCPYVVWAVLGLPVLFFLALEILAMP